MFSTERIRKCFRRNFPIEFQVCAENVSVEDWRLHKLQRDWWRRAPCDRCVVTADTRFDALERRSGLLPVSRDQVKGNLSVENILRQLLERKQVYSLLVQLIHSFLSVLRRRLVDSRNQSLNSANLPCSQ